MGGWKVCVLPFSVVVDEGCAIVSRRVVYKSIKK